MMLVLNDLDGWTRAQLKFNPIGRVLPDAVSPMPFMVRCARMPTFPVTPIAYADGLLRWQKAIDVPFLSLSPGEQAGVRAGAVDYVAKGGRRPVRADASRDQDRADGREGAHGWDVARPAARRHGALTRAAAKLATQYAGRHCDPPPALTD